MGCRLDAASTARVGGSVFVARTAEEGRRTEKRMIAPGRQNAAMRLFRNLLPLLAYNSCGLAITPLMALAATTAGLAR